MKKTTLEEMLSAIAGELRENGRWGTAHIYEATRNVFATFNRREETPMHELGPMLLKEFEMYLRHRNCSWNTVSTYMKTVRSAYNRAVDRGMPTTFPDCSSMCIPARKPTAKGLWRRRKWGC